MSEPSETGGTSPAEHSSAARGGKTTSTLDVLRNIATQLLVISDAQLAIWKMKLIRGAALAVLALPLAAAFFALVVYGFVLLDRSAAAALDGAQYPAWFSPLVRGGFYTVFTSFAAWSFWRQNIGSMGSKE